MRAISLWQPWASLYLTARKIHETRSWFTAYRGALCIHAAKRKLTRAELLALPKPFAAILNAEFGAKWFTELPYGALIGRVDLERCMHTEDIYETFWFEGDGRGAPDDYWCGDFTPGRYAWLRGKTVQKFATPIAYAGQQGYFDVPDDLVLRAAA